MKFVEIKDLSVAELKKKRAALSEELFQARIKNSIGQLSNPVQIRGLRRDIAKINTAIVKKVAR
ncbi:50S ribosomal protein L29 [Bdellovibrio bacteriovorus]|uniref:Large ribosomal subunit protein uL29 n=3 Tax=Bdellovibrio bacteriovorus TaxID=959 RepID=RL29_BDEBA|nr:50S ribosomal protein L29 [Bdellovibrio bacteriovorus]Q6MJ22.1 RecName: Full=Large ribosomal subunit protein uL29; AltName: Full=50S ribosomal protein L29 [Bdellovibrio bacteriovorus HD100]BFD60510.1 50S ribosomal protein L29 [Bdellovibrio sp. CKG001]BFD63925.1 50S ribosomal protein L29 [Bdellovibrio sp. HM001]BFD68113.1 50S ribosomal protein L29 [Bdellovibrio sp. HAGR004]AFY02580.1 50S ribosomal protein L29 [Bdellovibrio bacteriovorus str. Tiberius]AHZ83368.1 50S ribosomal protein L29 [Bd